jgi:hypothetical protein
MNRKEIESPSRARERVVDWLGAQGPLLLSVYMCSIVALVAFVAEMVG